MLRLLRPGIQVPLANACACGGIAAIVMHFGRTAAMRPQAFAVGVLVAVIVSLLLLRLLFVGSPDAHRARVRAALWPPLVGAVVGIAADGCMHLGGGVSVSFAGVALGGGAPELMAIAVLGALAGTAGTALLLPQVSVLHRSRLLDPTASRVALAADRLGVVAWGVASLLAMAACALADERETATACALALACVTGGAGQWLRWHRLTRASAPSAALVAAPYRRAS